MSTGSRGYGPYSRPFSSRNSKALDLAFSGWQLTGIFTAQGGTPLTSSPDLTTFNRALPRRPMWSAIRAFGIAEPRRKTGRRYFGRSALIFEQHGKSATSGATYSQAPVIPMISGLQELRYHRTASAAVPGRVLQHIQPDQFRQSRDEPDLACFWPDLLGGRPQADPVGSEVQFLRRLAQLIPTLYTRRRFLTQPLALGLVRKGVVQPQLPPRCPPGSPSATTAGTGLPPRLPVRPFTTWNVRLGTRERGYNTVRIEAGLNWMFDSMGIGAAS